MHVAGEQGLQRGEKDLVQKMPWRWRRGWGPSCEGVQQAMGTEAFPTEANASRSEAAKSGPSQLV